MLPCRLRRRKFRKSGCEMVYSKIYSKVYLNKYVVSIAPFSYPTFTPTPHAYSENWSFCMFSLFNFLSIFSRGVSRLHLPLYADAHDSVHTSGLLLQMQRGLCVPVCLLVTTLSCAKPAEPIEMPSCHSYYTLGWAPRAVD